MDFGSDSGLSEEIKSVYFTLLSYGSAAKAWGASNVALRRADAALNCSNCCGIIF